MAEPLHAYNDDHDIQDEDWEYEYDATETDDFYFTIDLTAHVPDAINEQEKHVIGRTPTGADHDEDLTGQDASSPQHETIQILDLHSKSPIIKFNQGIYSSYWSSDYGSQVYVTEAGTVQNARQPGHVLDVIGLSQARLFAVPTVLRKRDATGINIESTRTKVPKAFEADLEQSKVLKETHWTADDEVRSDQASEWNEEVASRESGSFISGSQPGRPLVIDRETCRDTRAVEAASFLEQLSIIKQRKGETDQIPIFSVKYYHPPSAEEQQAIKERAVQEDAATGATSVTGEGQNIRKRRRLTKKETGALRRDGGEDDLDLRNTYANQDMRSGKATARRLEFQDER